MLKDLRGPRLRELRLAYQKHRLLRHGLLLRWHVRFALLTCRVRFALLTCRDGLRRWRARFALLTCRAILRRRRQGSRCRCCRPRRRCRRCRPRRRCCRCCRLWRRRRRFRRRLRGPWRRRRRRRWRRRRPRLRWLRRRRDNAEEPLRRAQPLTGPVVPPPDRPIRPIWPIRICHGSHASRKLSLGPNTRTYEQCGLIKRARHIATRLDGGCSCNSHC